MAKLRKKQRQTSEIDPKIELQSRLKVLEEQDKQRQEELTEKARTELYNAPEKMLKARAGQPGIYEYEDENGNKYSREYGIYDEKGVLIPTLEEFKQQEIRAMINESIRRSNARTNPTNLVLKPFLSVADKEQILNELKTGNFSTRPDKKTSLEKQLRDNCLYGYTCALTASSNMPRQNNLAKGEGIGFKNRNSAIFDYTKGLVKTPGFFASNSNFRNHYADYGYELVDDVNHINGDKDYNTFLQNARPGDLLQRWIAGTPTHLMTYVGNDGGDIFFVNDSTGQFTPEAIRKNHKYKVLDPNQGSSLYRFVGDKLDHKTMEDNYNYLYK